MKKKFGKLLVLLAVVGLAALVPFSISAESALHSAFYNDVDGDGTAELVPLVFHGRTSITREYFYTQSNAVPFDIVAYGGPGPDEDSEWDRLYNEIIDKYDIDPYGIDPADYEAEGKAVLGEDSDLYPAYLRDCAAFYAFDEAYNVKYDQAYQAWQKDLAEFQALHPDIVFGHTVNPALTATTTKADDALIYWLHVPYDYDPQKEYPVFVYAHGEDQKLRTANYLNPDGTFKYDRMEPLGDSGFNTIFGKWYEQVKNPGAGRDKYDCFVIYIMNTNEFFRGEKSSVAIVNQYNDYDTPDAYQLTAEDTGDTAYKATYSRVYDASKLSPGYQEQLVCQLIDSLAETYSVDLSRQYVAGFSLGGIFTADIISHYPDRFACAVPICTASADISEENAKALTYTNIWAFAGAGDGTCNKYFSKLLPDAVNDAREKFGTGLNHTAQYSFFPGGHSGGHAKCSAATATAGVSTKSDLDLLNFIFDSQREAPVEICRVGDDVFGTLAAAVPVAAATGEEICLVTDTSAVDFADAAVKLNLDGHRLTGEAANARGVTVVNTGAPVATLSARGTYANDVSRFAADGYDAVASGDGDETVKNRLFPIENSVYSLVAEVTAVDRDPEQTGIDVYAGDTVEVTVTVSGARFVAADVILTWDSNRFTPQKVPAGWTACSGGYRFCNFQSQNGYYPNGATLGAFTFTVGATDGEMLQQAFAFADSSYIVKSWTDGLSGEPAVPLEPEQLFGGAVNVRLKPLSVTVTPKAGLQYTGMEQPLLDSVAVTDGISGAAVEGATMKYALVNTDDDSTPSAGDYLAAIPKAVADGTYELYWQAAATGYADAAGHLTVVIGKGLLRGYDLSGAPEVYYDGKPHAGAAVAVAPDAPAATATFRCSGDGGKTWSEPQPTVPSLTAANEIPYQIELTLTAAHYEPLTLLTEFSLLPVNGNIEISEYIAGWDMVFVYTDDAVPGFSYDGMTMYDMTDLGYRYGALWDEDGCKLLKEGTAYRHTFGLLVPGNADADLVLPCNTPTPDDQVLKQSVKGRCDVNCSRSVDINDLVAVAAVYNVNPLYLSNPAAFPVIMRADVSGDGKVDTYDCALIKCGF